MDVSQERSGEPDEAKAYAVVCDDCPLEQRVEGRHRAADAAREHNTETGHEAVVLELPPNQ